MSRYRFIIGRRLVQFSILFLYFGANAYGWQILTGTLSSSTLFGVLPLADPFAVLQLFVAGAILGIDVIVGAILITLFYGVIAGRSFCSWVCPINIVTDLARWLRDRLYLNQIDRRRRIRVSPNVRYWMIGLTFVVSFITGVGAFEFISPITILNRAVVFSIGASIAVVAVIFLFDLFVLKSGWCGHVCPLGGFYALVGKWAPLSINYDKPNCTLCMECIRVCPEPQVLDMIGQRSDRVLKQECTNCGRCIEVCEGSSLEFSIVNIKNKGEQ
jgi:ferredoxin-type protein NapH